MRLRTRVARLASAAQTAPSGCVNCRTWAPVVLLQAGEEARPERCPTCGRVVPIRLIRVYHLVSFDPSEPLPDVLAVCAAEGDAVVPDRYPVHAAINALP